MATDTAISITPLADLIAVGVRAAVVAPERELSRRYWEDTIVDDLVHEGRLERVDGHVTAAATASA